MKNLSNLMKKSLIRGSLAITLLAGANYFQYKDLTNSLTINPEFSIQQKESCYRENPKQTSKFLSEFSENKYLSPIIKNSSYALFKSAEFITRPGRSLAYKEFENGEKNKIFQYINNQKQKIQAHFTNN
jgi:hypothetical protein